MNMTKNKKVIKDTGNKRGPKNKKEDNELMEIALNIKEKFKHQEITPSILERETGIGRNTWSRRIKQFIDDINKPISRELGFSDDDVIYFPNIESLFETFGSNKNRIISELHKFELILQDIYKEKNEYKTKAKGYEILKKEFEEKEILIKELRTQLNHYKSEYEKIITASIEPELRKKHNIPNNLLDFKANKKNQSLTNLNLQFQKNKEENDSKENSIEAMFPNLFHNKLDE